jgi:RNA 2',3'-cyclic 3'-phosphodiesterase
MLKWYTAIMKKRLFIAINLPKTAFEPLAELIQRLKKINPSPAIRYVKPENVHLTLHFLGDSETQQTQRIIDLLNQTTTSLKPLTLQTTAIGAFPNLNRPRVIYLAATGPEANILIDWQKNYRRQLERHGISTDQRPWQPHLTLARIKNPVHFATAAAAPPQFTIPIRQLDLIDSELKPTGPTYSVVKTFALT